MSENRSNGADLLRECRAQAARLIWKIKQRWILRLIIIYSMCFWLVVQACAATFPMLGVTDGMLKLIVAAGLAGLPVTLMLVRGLRAATVVGKSADDPTAADHDPIESMSIPAFLCLIVATCLLILLLILQTWSAAPDAGQPLWQPAELWGQVDPR